MHLCLGLYHNRSRKNSLYTKGLPHRYLRCKKIIVLLFYYLYRHQKCLLNFLNYIHGYGELRIALPDSLPVAPEKIYIACLNKKEAALKSVLLHAEENSATSACMQTSIRTLGKYALCIDTIAPKVTVSGTPSYRRIAFNIGDTDSDIRSWQGDIDGVWVPFDMNAQGQVVARPETLARMGLLYRDGLEKGKNHIVTLTATDACGNITTCTTQVWF